MTVPDGTMTVPTEESVDFTYEGSVPDTEHQFSVQDTDHQFSEEDPEVGFSGEKFV